MAGQRCVTGETVRVFMSKKDCLWRWLTLSVVVLVSFISMPKTQYIGDPLAIRAAAVTWINNGHSDVPAEVAEQSGQRGQYYFQNPRNGRYYSKYGSLNTLTYLPVLYLERAVTGELPLYNSQAPRTMLLNLQNLLLSALLAYLLWNLASPYSAHPAWTSLWVLSCMFASFGWNYLRAQTSELWQWVLASAFMWGLLALWRRRGQVRVLVATEVALVLLILAKGVYALWGLVLLAVVFALFRHAGGVSNPSEISEGERLANGEQAVPNPGQPSSQPDEALPWLGGLTRQRYSLWVALPLLLGALLVLGLNFYKFGDPWASGYTQWSREANFFHGNIGEGMWGFFFSPAKSIFIYFPLLLIALGAWPSFVRCYRVEALAVLSAFVLLWMFNSATVNWGGHWSYGPRYLLVALAPLSLPALLAVDWLTTPGQRALKALGSGLAILLLAFSVWMQVQVNSLEFFTYYRVEAALQSLGAPQACQSVQRLPFGILNYQLRRFADSDRLPGFAQTAAQELSPQLSSQLQSLLVREAKGNYYWF